MARKGIWLRSTVIFGVVKTEEEYFNFWNYPKYCTIILTFHVNYSLGPYPFLWAQVPWLSCHLVQYTLLSKQNARHCTEAGRSYGYIHSGIWISQPKKKEEIKTLVFLYIRIYRNHTFCSTCLLFNIYFFCRYPQFQKDAFGEFSLPSLGIQNTAETIII